MGFLSSAWESIEDFGTDAGQFIQAVGESAVDATKFQMSQREDIYKPLLQGDFEGHWEASTEGFGEHQRMTTENLIDSGWSENNWAIQNSDTVAGIVAASILGYNAFSGSEGAVGGGEGGGMFEGIGDYFSDMDTGDWIDTASTMSDIFGSGEEGTTTQTNSGNGGRNINYASLIGRLNNLTSDQTIDPYEEIEIPSGTRY